MLEEPVPETLQPRLEEARVFFRQHERIGGRRVVLVTVRAVFLISASDTEASRASLIPSVVLWTVGWNDGPSRTEHGPFSGQLFSRVRRICN
jgi:hypothetical protein